MNLEIGTKIQYSCQAGTLNATITNIKVGPTARKGFLNTWLALYIPLQDGVSRAHSLQICGSNDALKMFKVVIVD